MAEQPIEIKITGLTQVEKVFFNLPKTSANRAYRPSLRAGGKVIKNLAVQNIKAIVTGNKSTGVLQKGIAVYSLKKQAGNFRVAVKIRKGLVNKFKIIKGEPVRVGLYAMVLEYGKQNQPPRSWLRKAIREGVQQAYNAIETEMSKRMIDAVRDAKQ